jgi:predicted nucleotidyltransferase
MLTRDDIVKRLREKRAYLAAEYGVSKIGIFGSYARGSATERSDVDLVVEFDKPIGFKFLELAEFLETVLGQKVDLLTAAGIENIRRERVAKAISGSVIYV